MTDCGRILSKNTQESTELSRIMVLVSGIYFAKTCKSVFPATITSLSVNDVAFTTAPDTLITVLSCAKVHIEISTKSNMIEFNFILNFLFYKLNKLGISFEIMWIKKKYRQKMYVTLTL
jgi:hypothetical protein